MIKRRPAAAGLPPSTCCHTFQATGITAYLSNGGTLEHAQQIAGARVDSPCPPVRSYSFVVFGWGAPLAIPDATSQLENLDRTLLTALPLERGGLKRTAADRVPLLERYEHASVGPNLTSSGRVASALTAS